MAGGRPTKYSQDAVVAWLEKNKPDNPTDAFLEARKSGLTKAHSAALAGIARKTIHTWENCPEKPEFLHALKEAEGLGAKAALDALKASERGWQRFAWLLERSFGYTAPKDDDAVTKEDLTKALEDALAGFIPDGA